MNHSKYIQVESGSSSGFGVSKNEVYEKEEVKDKLFYKFWKKLKPYPSQVIRCVVNRYLLCDHKVIRKKTSFLLSSISCF